MNENKNSTQPEATEKKTPTNIQKKRVNTQHRKQNTSAPKQSFKDKFNNKSHRKHPNQQGGKKPHHKNVIPELAEGRVRVIPIGGTEQIGQNMNIIETKDDIFIVDIGIQFSNGDTPGVDYIIPNTNYLVERKHKIRAVFVTHGHLDHIGAFPYIIDQLGYPPVYCGLLTKWMIDKRNSEFPHLEKLTYHVVKPGQRVTVEGTKMKVKIFHVTHSIPDAIGFSFETEQGNIILAGDTKLNHKDGVPDKVEIEAYSELETETQKNLLFLSDSTSAERPGWSKNENDIIKNIIDMIGEAKSRVFIGTFASQVTRLTAVIEGAHKFNKKIVLEGRSIKTNIEICIQSGTYIPPKGVIITADEARHYAPDKLVYLLTGSQGEEFAALMRISAKRHPKIRFNSRDTVILSSSVIPGNDLSVRKLKDNLSRHDLRLVQYQTSEIHASGHGNQDELLWIQKTIGAKFFMPIHGFHSMLRAHALAVVERNGFEKSKIIIPDNGSIIDLNKDDFVIHKAKAPNNITTVEGFRVGDIQDVVIRDRKTLTQEGIFVVIATIDPKTGKLRKSPDIISRGFVYLRDSQELINETRNLIKKTITKTASGKHPADFEAIKKNVTDTAQRFLVQNTGKRPIVIPVILGV